MIRKSKRITVGKVVQYLFLAAMGVCFAAPMLFTILAAFKRKTEIFNKPFSLPETWLFSNFVQAWKGANMSIYFVNSLIQAGCTIVLIAVVSSLAAYALSRFRFRSNKLILAFFTIGMMIPIHTVLVPISYMIGALHLKNNIAALVLIYVAFGLSFSTLILTNYMREIDKSLEEAALIDGAGYFTIYRRIMLPLSVPAISTVSIFNFLSTWNNILFPLLFINDKNLKPISLGLLTFNGEHGSDYGPLMASIVITVAVPTILYLVFQEKVEGGLAAGAVKG